MKTKILFAALLLSILLSNCKKDISQNQSDNYSSLQDFYSKNKPRLKTYTISGVSGGTFITSHGTKVKVPANCFLSTSGTPITSNVEIKFKDLLTKSEMLLSDMSTTYLGRPLKSGGEFFIQAIVDNAPVLIASGKNIEIDLNANLTGGFDTINVQQPFILKQDSVAQPIWAPTNLGTLTNYQSQYVFSLYQFSNPVDSGTWCNSDNASYFNSFPTTTLTLIPSNNTGTDTDVFLIFKNVNSMVHVYKVNQNYPYLYAPVGLQCTAVAISELNGKLYSSFVPKTISANQTINLNLTETTTQIFRTAIDALN